MNKRLLCTLLAGTLILAGSIFPVAAQTDTATVKGNLKTVVVKNQTAYERETNFNKDWKFSLTNADSYAVDVDDSAWSQIDLPHDFSIIQNFTTSGEAESGFLPGGTGWYRKTFTLTEADSNKVITINFDGVYSDSYVYVNGNFVGENHYGYNNFSFDITKYLKVGENVIAVKAVNDIPTSRWYSGSGIYRDVTLIVTDKVHVDLNGTQIATNNSGKINFSADILNESDSSVDVTVKNNVYAKGSDTSVANSSESVSVSSNSSVKCSMELNVSDPKIWGIDSPNLYTMVTTLYVDGKIVDEYSTDFGFREFSFDSNGFHLNGENVKLNGVCLHHDQGALGSAAYYDAMYRQLSMMKDMGANAIRVTHNPADEDLINICNELGLLVVEEFFDGWTCAKNGNSNDFSKYFKEYAETVVTNVIKRDRNAPCVIAWSLGNEIQGGTSGNYSEFTTEVEKLIKYVNNVDTTRPVTIGDDTRGSDNTLSSVVKTIVDNSGIAGFNYANYSELNNLANEYGRIIASETTSATNSRGVYSGQNNNTAADGNYHLTSYDTSAVNWGMTAHESIYNIYRLDNVAGEFVWTGFDYIGEPTPYNNTDSGSKTGYAYPNSSYFGIVDTAGFEKDTYYLYRSQWNKDSSTLHLVTAWDSDNMMTTDGKTPVVIYSNAAKVELYLNDELIGTAVRSENTSNAGHTYYTYTVSSSDNDICTAVSASGAKALYATFNVKYSAGTISAKAYDENQKEITENCVGNYSVSTPDDPSKLVISPNKTETNADGSSLVYISVDVTDKNGNIDTTANNSIAFSLVGNGEIVGVDNGDQATTEKYQQSSVLKSSTSAEIKAYAGKALVIVRSTESSGSFTVIASSNGIESDSVTVKTNAVEIEKEVILTGYSYYDEYTVYQGTEPELDTTAVGYLSNETTINGSVVWDNIPKSVYSADGDHTVNGVLTVNSENFDVSCTLHVLKIANTEKVLPKVKVSMEKNGAKIKVLGTFTNYSEKADCFEVTSHGVLFIKKDVLRFSALTADTLGRTRVTFGEYSEDGEFWYSFTPESVDTDYVVCAFIVYVDSNGNENYVYSDLTDSKYSELN